MEDDFFPEELFVNTCSFWVAYPLPKSISTEKRAVVPGAVLNVIFWADTEIEPPGISADSQTVDTSPASFLLFLLASTQFVILAFWKGFAAGVVIVSELE